MIPIECFVTRSSDRERWLEARSRGVTATMVAEAFTPAGFDKVTDDIRHPVPVTDTAFMAWGRLREAAIAERVKDAHGVLPNDWLICRPGVDNWMMATPDGLSVDHRMIGEYKTTGKPFEKIPARYMRQCQWQLWVTGAESCVFAWELREPVGDWFAPGFDIHMEIVERDEKLIRQLVEVAQRVQMVAVYESQMEGNDYE